MEKALYIITLFCVLVDLFLMGSVAGFLQKKIVVVDFFRFLIPTLIIASLLAAGLFLGKYVSLFFEDYRVWYAATILLILSFKLMYDGLKLNQLKKAMNPLDRKGILYLSVLIGINAFFIGAAFGLLGIPNKVLVYSILSLYFILVAGYFRGLSLKKLMAVKNDLWFAAVLLIIAMVIAIKL